jgi:peptide methionine sulfoxide reductase MsrB
MGETVSRSDAAWRRQLTRERHRVTWLEGAERPFTGACHATRTPRIDHCMRSGQALFDVPAKVREG